MASTTRTVYLAAALTAALVLSGCAGGSMSADPVPATDPPAPRPTSSPVDVAAGPAVTAEVVTAAQTFLDSLSPETRDRVVFDADDPALRSWIYFPTTNDRNGISLGDLSDTQRDAALRLVDAVLSDSGFAQVQSVLAAEDELGARNNDRNASSDRYFISLFGEPDATARFTVQLNGHHLAVNHTFESGRVSPTPAFTGVDPTTIDVNGQQVRPMLAETDAFSALVEALGEGGLAAARIDPIDDVLVGVGESTLYPQQEGVRVADLDDIQQARVVDVIRAWVGDTDERLAETMIAEYVAEFDSTTISWTGPADPDERGAYLRIDGPRLWIEFVNVGVFGNGDAHYHSIWRDRAMDYLG